MTRTKASLRKSLTIVGWCCSLVVWSACRSASVPMRQGDVPGEPVVTLVDIDSLVFASVVRGQLQGNDDEYPHRLERYRYDSRPYGTNSGYPEVFAGIEGIDPTLSFPRASQSDSEIGFLVQTRKRILDANGAPEGKLISYPQCAGAAVPPPPPPKVKTSRRAKPVDVHAGCPKQPEYYLTVGLPIRGQPPGLRNLRDTHGDRVNLDGDVWTVLVDETLTRPEGWSRSTYAWLFRRDRSGRLELANTILIGVIQ